MTATDDAEPPVADLAAVLVSVGLVVAVAFSPAGAVRPLALAVGVPFVVLAPGYALVSALFPHAGETGPESSVGAAWLGRLGLSVGGSVVAVAAVGGILDFTIWGFSRGGVVIGLSLWTVGATAIAWYRRRRVPTGERAGTDLRGLWAGLRTVVAGEGILGIVLTLVVVVAFRNGDDASAGVSVERRDVVVGCHPAGTDDPDGEFRHTSLYPLTE